jgi:hypothetical protein
MDGIEPCWRPRIQNQRSLCTSAFSAATFVINATSTVLRTEPVLEWDFERGDYETGEIRKQLGAVHEWSAPEDRVAQSRIRATNLAAQKKRYAGNDRSSLRCRSGVRGNHQCHDDDVHALL